MRLTLRTLLAYLDNILEPEDRKLIENKVQESEFAQNLIKRSREAVNDPEASATDPIGHGLQQDPNSVAEYLDNTMAREQIEEFERQCLDTSQESDTRLAEITSCHHILTMVLGDPVHFAATSRERMYRIGENETSFEQAYNEEQVVQTQPAVSTTESAHAFSREENSTLASSPAASTETFSEDALYRSRVPDYLREQHNRNRWLPIVATTLVAAVVTGVLLILFEPGPSKDEQGKAASLAQATPQTVEESTPPDKQASFEANPQVVPRGGNPADAPEQPQQTADVSSTAESKKAAPSEGATKAAPENPADASGVVTEPVATDQSQKEEKDTITEKHSPVETGEGDSPSGNTPAPKVAVNENKPTATGEEKNAENKSADGIASDGNQVIGRLVSDDQILLASPTGTHEYRWLSQHSKLEKGHTLVSLPAFRPNLSLIALTVELEGGSMLKLLNLGEGGTPTIELSYGQMVVRTNLNGGTFRLRVGDERIVTLTLQDTATAIGVEVRPQPSVGSDPETSEREFAIKLYALSGTTAWQEGPRQGVVQAGQYQDMSPLSAAGPESFSAAPDWLTKVSKDKLESRAVPAVRSVVQADRNVKLSLLELIDKSPRVEVKQLALRSCAHISYFEPLIESLGDETMERRWEKYATYLQNAVRRRPENAKKVRAAMERMRDEKGHDLYRMLWGYTNEGLLSNGEAEQLVGFLSSEDLDFRVLSWWNLKNITGKGYTYQANSSEAKRRKPVKRWNVLLEKGDIKHQPKN